MRSRAVRHAGRCIGLVAMVGAPSLAHAQDARTSLTASIGGSAETNPYNEVHPNGAAVAATAEFHPSVSVTDGTTSADITGYAQFRQFLRRYGLEDNYGANTDISTRVSERLTLRGTGSFSYNEGGFNSYGLGLSQTGSTVDPVTGTLLNPVDVNLLGRRTRTTSIGSSVGADAQLTAYSSLSLSLEARSLRFQLASFNDYNSYSGDLQYSHTIGELWSVGLIGSLSKTNYLSLFQGDATSSSIMASLDRKFGSRWSLSMSAGGSFTDIDATPFSPAIHFNSLSGHLKLCWKGQFSNICLNGDRSAQPAAEGNVRVSTTISADYSLRLSDRENFSLSASYARTGAGHTVLLPTPAIDYASAYARYDNQFDRKLSAFVTANVSKFYSPLSRTQANLGIAFGLQVRLGAAAQ